MIKNYKTKNIGVQKFADAIKSSYGQIDAIRARAEMASNPGAYGALGAFEDGTKSMISDIKSFFGSISMPKGQGMISQNSMQMMQKKDQEDIRAVLSDIDKYLT